MLTMPKFTPQQAAQGGLDSEDRLRALTQAAVATAYSLGSPMLAPWDIYEPGSVWAPSDHPYSLPTDPGAAAAGVTGVLTQQPSLAQCEHACVSRAACKGVRWLADTPAAPGPPGGSARCAKCWALRAPLRAVGGTAVNGSSETKAVSASGAVSFLPAGTGAAGDGKRFLLPTDTTAGKYNVTGALFAALSPAECEGRCAADARCAGVWMSPVVNLAPCWALDKIQLALGGAAGNDTDAGADMGAEVGAERGAEPQPQPKPEPQPDVEASAGAVVGTGAVTGMSLLRGGNPRYFGNVSDYAPLFSFVRRAAGSLLDGAANATVLGLPQSAIPARAGPCGAAGGGEGGVGGGDGGGGGKGGGRRPPPFVAVRALPPSLAAGKPRWAVHVIAWPGTECEQGVGRAVQLQSAFFGSPLAAPLTLTVSLSTPGKGQGSAGGYWKRTLQPGASGGGWASYAVPADAFDARWAVLEVGGA
jgi:hypothetical protein